MACHLIWAHGRSGSSDLMRAMRDGCKVKAVMEPFGKTMGKRGLSKSGPAFHRYIESTFADAGLVKHLFDPWTPEGNRAIAGRVTGRFIFLYRRQLFEAAISKAIARRRRFWGAVPEDQLETQFKAVPPQEVGTEIERTRADIAANLTLLRELGAAPMVISYEDIYSSSDLDHRFQVFKRLSDFFGFEIIDPAAARALLAPERKYNSAAVYEKIPNWSELQTLAGEMVEVS